MDPTHLLAAEKADAAGGDWLDARRRRGRELFDELGWPTRKLEGWKYVGSRALRGFGTEVVPEPDADVVERARPAVEALDVRPAVRIALVNGWRASSLEQTSAIPDGVEVLPLSEAREHLPAMLEAELGRIAPLDEAAFAALNLSVLQDALVVRIRKGAAVEAPLELVHAAVPTERTGGAHPRVLVLAEPGSECTFVERYVGVEGEPTLTNAVSEVVAQQNATVRHVRLVAEADAGYHVGMTGARVDRDASYRSHVVSLSGRLGRSELQVRLAEAGAGCSLDGLYVSHEHQHLDHYTVIDHAVPRTTSHELYKGVIDDRGTGSFYGRVLIGPGAGQCETHQLNNNLLLTEGATAHTRPQLEIDNNDVVATHGSTVGQLDEDGIFYLCSRGLDEPSARALLTWAFAVEMIDRLPGEALREELAQRLTDRLAEGASPAARAVIEESSSSQDDAEEVEP